MDFRTELAKWGYNKGNSIDVEILIDEILPSLFSQQQRSHSDADLTEKLFNHPAMCRIRDSKSDAEARRIILELLKKK